VIVPPQSLFPPKEPEEALALDGPPLMSVDPNECRQHALDCVRMSQTSNTPEAREIWSDLAKTWLRFAFDLEANAPSSTLCRFIFECVRALRGLGLSEAIGRGSTASRARRVASEALLDALIRRPLIASGT
jgi:hypothetical protein